ELEGVAGRVEQEQGRLFADFALEANVWFDDELHAGSLQPVRERSPGGGVEHGAEVAHGHGVAVDAVGSSRVGLLRAQVRHDLMAVEVEVDPAARASPFGAPEQL